jgi:hypothetical protein
LHKVKFSFLRSVQYDIGVYFEANGHGTVYFSDRFLAAISVLTEDVNKDSSFNLAVRRLKVCFHFFQIVGLSTFTSHLRLV